MLLHPEHQKKLQAELDTVNAHGRAISMQDIHNMPYFNAVWKESLRWSTPAPLGLPHVNSEDDVWNGYFIPKGSAIYFNIGFVVHSAH